MTKLTEDNAITRKILGKFYHLKVSGQNYVFGDESGNLTSGESEIKDKLQLICWCYLSYANLTQLQRDEVSPEWVVRMLNGAFQEGRDYIKRIVENTY
jgi:hypothetical protein